MAAALLGVLALGAAAAGEEVRGRLVDASGAPVPGVTITVAGTAGPVGSSTSGDDGRWRLAIPGPAQYRVRLDTTSLPAGLSLRRGADAERRVQVAAGAKRNVVFPLGVVADTRPGVAERVAQRLVEGVQFGALIAMTAIGLSLIFGTTGLINFAHGELVTLGAVVAYFLNAADGGPGIHIALAAVVAAVVGGLFGGALERGLWRPLRRRRVGLVAMFIATIGLSLVLRQLILIAYGGNPHSYAQYALQRTWSVGPVDVAPREVATLAVSAGLLLAVALLLTRSRLGRAMRAVADDRDLADCSGIDVDRIVLLIWILGGALAAAGGVLYGLDQTVTWNMGLNLLLLMFAGVILGGLGSPFGAVVGCLVVGILAQVSTAFFASELQTAWALGLLIVVLLVRPQGLLGRRERVG